MIYSIGLMSNFEYLLVKCISETGGTERFFFLNNTKFGGVLKRYFSCISYLTKITHLSFLQLISQKIFIYVFPCLLHICLYSIGADSHSKFSSQQLLF